MALKGIKVIELSGLAPVPYAGMILSDFGARVIRVDRTSQMMIDNLARGKLSIALNWKKPEGMTVLRKLCKSADVLIEPFRPGVMEKMGLGPDSLLKENPQLIYARLSGFGQSGPYKLAAGHDINYIALSGLLSQIGRQGEKPIFPINLLADFGGGGMICALGVCLALIERSKSGLGQVIDANMVEGSAYLGAFTYCGREMLFPNERGTNLLDTGAHFYETYQTLDDKYLAVGAIEPQFYAALLKGLELNQDDLPDQMNSDEWPAMKKIFTTIFASKTLEDWVQIFEGTDACVTPILSPAEAPLHPQNKTNKTFLVNNRGAFEPSPAPKLSRTPGMPHTMALPDIGQDTASLMRELGYSDADIKRLQDEGAVECSQMNSKL